jgi:transcriptional regulator with PAS, ATPase and Fis domain
MEEVIVISKSPEIKEQCVKLECENFKVSFFSSNDEFQKKKLKKTAIKAVFFDIELFSEGTFDCSLEKLRDCFECSPLFLWSKQDNPDFETIVKSYGLSGMIFLSDTTQSICKKLHSLKLLNEDAQIIFPEILNAIVGTSRSIQQLKKKILSLAKTNLSVLLLGETGCGKNLTARILHDLSDVAEGPFVQANPARLPLDLCEGELFGYKKGSFTGAVDNNIGLFENADGGSLFLDEIDSIPYPIQAKLLTAIDEGKIWRLGERSQRLVHTRIISATNVSLSYLQDTQNMRKDFFYRIAGDIITLPPLREHLEDIPDLVESFLLSQPTKTKLSASALDKLYTYEWKGNVRELNITLLRAIGSCNSSVILSKDIVFL